MFKFIKELVWKIKTNINRLKEIADMSRYKFDVSYNYTILKERFNELEKYNDENLKELSEYKQAKDDNRLFVSPFSIGSSIYYILSSETHPNLYNNPELSNYIIVSANMNDYNKFVLVQLTISGFIIDKASALYITVSECPRLSIIANHHNIFTNLDDAIKQVINITQPNGGSVKVIK